MAGASEADAWGAQVITSEDCHVPYNALLEVDQSSHDGSRHGFADVCVHSVYSDSASMEV